MGHKRVGIPTIRLVLLSLFFSKAASDFDESNFVNTNKNALIRRTISLKESVVGKAAVLNGPCDKQKYEDKVKPIYAKNDQNLSIFERSDMLFKYLVELEKDVESKGNASTMRQETCGANHLMFCDGTCKCMGDAAGEYPEYKALKATEIGTVDYGDGTIETYHECRVSVKGALCNTRGLLFCDMKHKCVTKAIKVPPGKPEKAFRCQCVPATKSEDFEDDPVPNFGYPSIKIPKNDCRSKSEKKYLRKRSREFQ